MIFTDYMIGSCLVALLVAVSRISSLVALMPTTSSGTRATMTALSGITLAGATVMTLILLYEIIPSTA